jgi:adenylate cyclase
MNGDEDKLEKSGSLESSLFSKDMPSHEFKPALTQRIRLANMRHEMRTPLNAIIGYSEMLMEDAKSLNQENFVLHLQKIHSSGMETLELVDKILISSNVDGKQAYIDRKNFEGNFTNVLRKPLDDIIGNTEILIDAAHEPGLRDFIPDLEKIQSSSQNFLEFIKKIAHCSATEKGVADVDLEDSETSAMIEKLVGDILPVSHKEASPVTVDKSYVLIVDDNVMNRDLLSRHFKRQGHNVATAENGRQALEIIKKQPFDVILLDILMPEMNGYQVLHKLKNHKIWRDIPIIMISALEELDIVAHCIEVGADDYLVKPFNPVLLNARINSCLERKRLHDLEKEQKRILSDTFAKYVAQEVRDEVLSGRIPLDGEIKDVSILFADLRDFTPLTESTSPKNVVRMLNTYFSEMAPAIQRHRGSILRYVGDEIYAVFGAPLPLKDHPRYALEAALDMRSLLEVVNEKLERQDYPRLNHGIGIHSGLVVAANIGSPQRLAYDFVGDTVNLASRIQGLTKSFGADILISAATRDRITDYYALEKLPAVNVKGKKNPVELFRVI